MVEGLREGERIYRMYRIKARMGRMKARDSERVGRFVSNRLPAAVWVRDEPTYA